MTALPPPLVDAEVDLRDYAFMPLYGDRLFTSDTWIEATAEGKVAALRLWWKSWHQEPAGSLPDSDRLLADLAGYGVAVSAFLKIKSQAMRGWIKCSDGRLYHPVVCQIANDVWQTKKKRAADNAAERERKRRKRAARPPDTAPPSAGHDAGSPAENALKGSGREEEDSPPPSGAPPSADETAGFCEIVRNRPSDPVGSLANGEMSPMGTPVFSAPEGGGTSAGVTLAADHGSAPAPTAAPKRGTRLPADWTLPAEWRAYAVEHGVNADREAVKFAAHFHSADCKRPVKKDWRDAWQRWVRTAVEYGGSNGKRSQHPSGFGNPFLAAYAEGQSTD